MPFPTRLYLVEDLFAVGSVNLIAGMSGAGKTKFMFQIVEELEKQKSLLNFKLLQQIRCKYFAFDRSQAACWDILNRMSCFPSCEIISKFSSTKSFDDIAMPTDAEIGDANFVILDGFDFVVKGNVIDLRTVGKLMFDCNRLAERLGICILGALGTAKVKSGDGYEHPRERIIGSSAWARLSETILLMYKPSAPDSKPSERIIEILTRNSSEFSINLAFNEHGRLVPTIMSEPSTTEYKFLNSLPDSFTSREAEDIGLSLGIKRSLVFQIIKQLTEQRLVSSIARGLYKRSKVN